MPAESRLPDACEEEDTRHDEDGEAWEQVLELGGQIAGFDVDPQAEVRWRDTEARALAATVDALGKMAQMLSIPPQELWERVPGVSQQDVERWKVAAEEGDVFAQMNRDLPAAGRAGELHRGSARVLMALTRKGSALTELHRKQQLALRALLVQRIRKVYPLWRPEVKDSE